MASIAQQKSDMIEIIINQITQQLQREDKDYAVITAIAACQALADKMTLKDLKRWNTAMAIADTVGDQRVEKRVPRGNKL